MPILSWCCWTSSSAAPFPAVTHPTADRARCCFTFFFDCLLFRRSSIQVPTRPGAAGLHLRLSRFPAVTHPTVTEPGAPGPFLRCCFPGLSSALREPSPVLLDLFLRLSLPQAVTHPCAELAWCCWTAVAFPAVTHPTADRAWCCLTFFFYCLLYRWSPIQVPTWHGSPGLRLRLSRFPTVTHPTAGRARCCLTLFFDCLLFR